MQNESVRASDESRRPSSEGIGFSSESIGFSNESVRSSTGIRGRLRYLTLSMVLLLVLYSFLQRGVAQAVIINVLVSAVCIFAVYAVSYYKRNLLIALVLGVPWFVASWITAFNVHAPLIVHLISVACLMLFYAFTALVLLSFVLKSERVNEDVLYGSVSIYLLIGGTFSMVYLLIEVLHPGSFYVDPAFGAGGPAGPADLLYYSFATLTTLGYGDITPVTSHARNFAVTEAITGVMYLAIIISRLVGLYIAHSPKQE